MKKLILCLVVAAFAFTATAQETEKARWKGHSTNKFWDNWEISAGAGVNISTHDIFGGAGKTGLSWNAGLTKWIVPIVGVRAQVEGDKLSNYPNRDQVGNRAEWPSLFAHADVMLNLSNWIGGYREDRAYYAVPFVGFGYLTQSYKSGIDDKLNNKAYPATQTIAGTIGLLNKFRVCKQIDINLELKGYVFHANKIPAPVWVNGRCEFDYSATLGLSYRFNKRGWDKSYTKADFQKYIDEAAAMRDQLAAANAARAAAEEAAAKAKSDAERAAARAAAAEAEAAAAAARAAAAAKGVYAAGNSVFFNIGSSKLSATDKVRLSLIADQIKSGNEVYTINGYADKKTGTAAVNKRVSESRAKTVYNYLVSCGVSKDQLKYASYGDTVQPYGEGANYKANRAAILER